MFNVGDRVRFIGGSGSGLLEQFVDIGAEGVITDVENFTDFDLYTVTATGAFIQFLALPQWLEPAPTELEREILGC